MSLVRFQNSSGSLNARAETLSCTLSVVVAGRADIVLVRDAEINVRGEGNAFYLGVDGTFENERCVSGSRSFKFQRARPSRREPCTGRSHDIISSKIRKFKRTRDCTRHT